MAIEVQFFTLNHVIRGFIDTPGDRLTDILNIKTETALFVTKAQLFRLMVTGRTPPILIPDLRLEKNFILAALPIESDMTHKSLFRKVARASYEMTVLLPNYELRGKVAMSEKLDLRRGLAPRPEDFIPMTEATLVYGPSPQITIRANTIIFSKQHVGFLAEHPVPRESNTLPLK